MEIKELSEKITQEKRDVIKSMYDSNMHYNSQFGKHKHEPLAYLFKEWHELFPSQKQSLKCSGCRNAVVKFWGMMIDEWDITLETVENNNPVKTKKKVVSKRK